MITEVLVIFAIFFNLGFFQIRKKKLVTWSLMSQNIMREIKQL